MPWSYHHLYLIEALLGIACPALSLVLVLPLSYFDPCLDVVVSWLCSCPVLALPGSDLPWSCPGDTLSKNVPSSLTNGVKSVPFDQSNDTTQSILEAISCNLVHRFSHIFIS